MRKVTLLLATTALAVVLSALPAWADTTFVVDRTDDDATASAKACTAEAANDCSLRGAIIKANTTPGTDIVDVPEGTYTLTITGAGEGASATGDLDVLASLTIEGAGADSTTVAGAQGFGDRIFQIHPAAPPGVNATISGLTITGGSAGSDSGGGISNNGRALTVSESTISGNSAGLGGGIDSGGTLTVQRSTISANTAGRGAGLRLTSNYPDFTSEKTTITNSTISGNVASIEGGGVFANTGLTEIENSTITKNDAPTGWGSGVLSHGGDTIARTEVLSSIISDNTNTDVDFQYGGTNTFVSEGYNLIGDGNATGDFDATNGDQVGVTDPKLGALQDNGGTTKTHALQSDSPAMDAGNNTSCPTEDQRDKVRPADGDGNGSAICDIGSFEKETPTPPPPPPPPPDTTRPQTTITSGPSGPTNDNTPTFTFTGSDNVSAAADLRFSYKVDGAAWSAPSAATSVTLPALGNGAHTFSVKAIDEAGNEAETQDEQDTRTFTVDTLAPAGTVRINGGKAVTSKLAVRLNLRASDAGSSGVASVRISNRGSTLASAPWQPFSATKAWRLSRVGSNVKIVFVQYRDEAGNLSAVALDRIKYRRP